MSAAPSIIQIRNIVKRFGAQVTAVDDVSLEIREGEFFALLGPSGCGKTTLLRMLAGFEIPTSGNLLIDGQEMGGVAPNKRPVNMVFQSYAVFPHMSVFDNAGYGLKVTGTPKAEIRERVREVLALVHLEDYQTRKPDQLSGGQRQRVALARALIKRPRVLLLDEPLSALDAKLREAMQLELVKLQQMVGITFVIVTHDQNEALSMADRIAVMEDGKVRQIATPTELYEDPNCHFVADFIGKMNLLSGTVQASGKGTVTVAVEKLGTLTVPCSTEASGNLHLAIRPEKLLVSETPLPDHLLAFSGRVATFAYHGSESHVFVTTDSGVTLSATLPNRHRHSAAFEPGQKLWIGWEPEDTLVLTE